jgi:hypothetical protein
VYNKKGQCIVAAPGNSNHNYRIALDCETEKIKAYSNATFEKYGLRRPMAHEPWHIEPIESYGMSKEEKIKIRDSYREVKNVDIKGLQTAGKAIGVYNKTIDGTNGPGTKAAAEEFLPVVLQVLGLQDPRKLQDENVKLREKLNNIRAQATL